MQRLFAAVYDRCMAGAERAALGAHRSSLLGSAAGAVLEIGGGTGVNLAHYPAGVAELVVTEPAEPMARRLERRAAAQGPASGRAVVRVVRAHAEQLPFVDASFDTAVSTLVLCTVTSPQRALAELHRVLRPGGRLLFVEHVRADDPRLARRQDRLNRLQRFVAQGCNCNRSTLESIVGAGFALEQFERTTLPKAPAHLRPLVVGSALRP